MNPDSQTLIGMECEDNQRMEPTNYRFSGSFGQECTMEEPSNAKFNFAEDFGDFGIEELWFPHENIMGTPGRKHQEVSECSTETKTLPNEFEETGWNEEPMPNGFDYSFGEIPQKPGKKEVSGFEIQFNLRTDENIDWNTLPVAQTGQGGLGWKKRWQFRTKKVSEGSSILDELENSSDMKHNLQLNQPLLVRRTSLESFLLQELPKPKKVKTWPC